MLGNLKILQVNLNKSTTATESTLQLAIELKANIIAVQEPWLAPTNNDNYAQARSTIHQAFFQILPTADPSIRPRVMFYISRTLAAETYTLQNFKKDPDAMAIVVKGDNYQIHLINLYNQTNAEGTKTIPRVLLVSDEVSDTASWTVSPMYHLGITDVPGLCSKRRENRPTKNNNDQDIIHHRNHQLLLSSFF
jgi:hypothetical protein